MPAFHSFLFRGETKSLIKTKYKKQKKHIHTDNILLAILPLTRFEYYQFTNQTSLYKPTFDGFEKMLHSKNYLKQHSPCL